MIFLQKFSWESKYGVCKLKEHKWWRFHFPQKFGQKNKLSSIDAKFLRDYHYWFKNLFWVFFRDIFVKKDFQDSEDFSQFLSKIDIKDIFSILRSRDARLYNFYRNPNSRSRFSYFLKGVDISTRLWRLIRDFLLRLYLSPRGTD